MHKREANFAMLEPIQTFLNGGNKHSATDIESRGFPSLYLAVMCLVPQINATQKEATSRSTSKVATMKPTIAIQGRPSDAEQQKQGQ